MIRTALAAAALAVALSAPAVAAEAPVSLTAAQAATGNLVDGLCGTPARRTCSSYAVAPPSFCGRHGATVECDFAVWRNADTRQCDARVVVKRVRGRLVVRFKDGRTWIAARHCHATYTSPPAPPQVP